MARMNEFYNFFALSPEQQDTARLLDELLGQVIAARYEDFCRLSAAASSLHVSKPMAAHALRELDSMLRGVLAVPMQAVATPENDLPERLKQARKALRGLRFDDNAITEALKDLTPRLNHRAQIRKIVSQLGLGDDGDIARKWIALTSNVGNAHKRSFHQSLVVDEDFRRRFQEPFDTVIRAVVVALRGRYTALLRRVEALACSPNYAQAVKDFSNEIPGAAPLQWHFFQCLNTGEWLPHLIKAGLVVEPLIPLESVRTGQNFGAWPLGFYLLKMATANEATRRCVMDALRRVAESNHPEVVRDGLAILAALPPSEAATLADLAVGWIARSSQVLYFESPNDLVKNLAKGQQSVAALTVARELLRLWGEERQVESHYSQHMYEHHLPALAEALTRACGGTAFELLVGLLHQASSIAGRSSYSHVLRESISDPHNPPFDICDALITVVSKSAENLIESDAVPMQEVIAVLGTNPTKVFLRLALHVLAKAPSRAPELATSYLLNRELITASWCQAEYAALAKAWYLSLSAKHQADILHVVDAVPDEYLSIWKSRFEEHHHFAPTADDERRYRSGSAAELIWKWREVLPPERRKVLEEAGDPNAWRAGCSRMKRALRRA